jgi:hypothetical protein
MDGGLGFRVWDERIRDLENGETKSNQIKTKQNNTFVREPSTCVDTSLSSHVAFSQSTNSGVSGKDDGPLRKASPLLRAHSRTSESGCVSLKP